METAPTTEERPSRLRGMWPRARFSQGSLLNWPVLSLRAYIVMVIVLATVPLVLFAAHLLYQQSMTAKSQVQDGLRRTADTFALMVEREIVASIDALSILSYSESLQRGDVRNFHRTLMQWPKRRPIWSSVYLADVDGRVLFSTDAAYGSAAGNVANSPEFQGILRTKSAEVSDLISPAGTDRGAATDVLVPVMIDGRLRYVLGARIEAAQWKGLMRFVTVPPGGFLSLFDGRSRVIAQSLGSPAAGSPQAQPAEAVPGDPRALHENTGATYAAWRQVSPAEWGVGVGMASGPLDRAGATAVLSALAAGLLSLGLGVALALSVARQVTVPLRRIAQGGARAAEGEIAVEELATLQRELLRAEQQREADGKELQAKADEFGTLFNSSPIGLAITHHPECDDMLLNPALVAMLGEALDAARAAGAAGVAVPNPVPGIYQQGRPLALPADLPICEAALAGFELRDVELEVVHADGRVTNLLVYAAPLPASDRQARGAVAAFVDITERKRSAAREQAARREAETANRAKDEFLAMLGHELRNPLGAVTAAVEVLNRVENDSTMAASARRIIARQIHHLAQLMNDLLDAARASAGKITLDRHEEDLAQVVQRAHGALQVAGLTRAHRVELALEPVWVEVDTTRMEQVVTNLLTNAVKYTPSGGSIQVSLRAEADEAVLKVKDSGTGISPSLLPRVFDLFAQGERNIDRRQGGLGIGLTLVRRLVELHGGTVEVQSEGPGRGSLFTVRLKRASAPPAQTALMCPPPQPRRRIVVVDDNADALQAMQSLLAICGHDVNVASDGESGLRAVLELEPDLALIDIGLPGLNGYEVAERVRAAGREVVLVAISGYGQPEDVERARQAGFDAHLVKPLDLQALQGVLEGLAASSPRHQGLAGLRRRADLGRGAERGA